MKRLLLAGAGHAHLHVLKTLATHRPADVEVTLLTPCTRQIYSGMLPGWMAGHYGLDQCAAPLEALLAGSGARFVRDGLCGVDAGRRIVHTQHSGDIAYDVLSLGIGAGLDTTMLAGTDATLLPIRPIETFIDGWTRQLETFRRQGTARIAVVGGGAAGIELALAARHRLAGELGADKAQVSLIVGGGLLPGHGRTILSLVRRTLTRHGVTIVTAYARGCNGGLNLGDGSHIAADCVIAATGVCPPSWLEGTGLARSSDGFVAVHDGQQSTSHPEVFAAGDIASRVDSPHAKSGVYAVRAGPILAANLKRALGGETPQPYAPQKRSLYLLATGPKEAIMSWGGLAAEGRWAWHWKDWIDRRFMRQYAPGTASGTALSDG